MVQLAPWVDWVDRDIYFSSFFWSVRQRLFSKNICGISINLQKFGLRFRIIFIHLVPCVTLICLNAKLIYGVAEAEKKRKALTNRNFRMANKDGRLLQKPKMRDLHRVSAMSAVIISVFLLLEIPLMVITILHAVQPNGDTNETVSQIIKKKSLMLF